MALLSEQELRRIDQIYREIKAIADAVDPNGSNRFSIFHAPARRKEVSCLIVGHRPGPKPLSHRHEYSEENSPPTENIIFTRNNPYSFNARNLFAQADRLPALSMAQSTDVHFFRAKDTLASVDTTCFKYFEEIVEIIRPRSMIVVGENAGRTVRNSTHRTLGSTFYYNDTIPCAVVWHFSRISIFDENAINQTIGLIRDVVPMA